MIRTLIDRFLDVPIETWMFWIAGTLAVVGLHRYIGRARANAPIDPITRQPDTLAPIYLGPLMVLLAIVLLGSILFTLVPEASALL